MVNILGLPGDRGEKGKKGADGQEGPPGSQGLRGPDGEKGQKGQKGREGFRGIEGEPGDRGPPASASGFYVTRHSQSQTPPPCPIGYQKMWDGYSLLYVQGKLKLLLMYFWKIVIYKICFQALNRQ